MSGEKKIIKASFSVILLACHNPIENRGSSTQEMCTMYHVRTPTTGGTWSIVLPKFCSNASEAIKKKYQKLTAYMDSSYANLGSKTKAPIAPAKNGKASRFANCFPKVEPIPDQTDIIERSRVIVECNFK